MVKAKITPIIMILLCFTWTACGQRSGGNQFIPVQTSNKQKKETKTGGSAQGTKNSGDSTENPVIGNGAQNGTPKNNTNLPSQTGSPSSKSAALECVDNATSTCAIEEAITKYTNEFRAQNGVAPLTHQPRVAYIARYWSGEMGKTGAISHNGIMQGTLYPQIYQNKFGTQAPGFYGENVLLNPGQYATADEAARAFVNQWINSPPHRDQMLKGHYTNLGGSAVNVGGTWWATQIFD